MELTTAGTSLYSAKFLISGSSIISGSYATRFPARLMTLLVLDEWSLQQDCALVYPLCLGCCVCDLSIQIALDGSGHILATWAFQTSGVWVSRME